MRRDAAHRRDSAPVVEMLAVVLVAAGAVASVVLTRRRTRPSAERTPMSGEAGADSVATADRGAAAARDHRRVVGCLSAGAGCALLFLVVPVVLMALIVRACQREDWVFDARVVRISEAEACLQLIDDGPGYVDGCARTGEIGILGLPSDIVDGDCLTLRQVLDGDLEYVARTTCP